MMRFSVPCKSWNGKGENILVSWWWRSRIPFLECILKRFILYIFVDKYKSRGSSPGDPESARTIQSPHPGLKIMEQSWRIPRHVRVCPWGSPPPRGWPLISASWISILFRPVCLQRIFRTFFTKKLRKKLEVIFPLFYCCRSLHIF